mgnify:CR=1 FL=1
MARRQRGDPTTRSAALLLAGPFALALAVLPARPAVAAACAPSAAEAAGADCIGPVAFSCPGGTPELLAATFFNAEPQRVEVEHGGRTFTAGIAPSGSGARYVGPDGFVFWTKGDGATVELPGGVTLVCTAD